MPFKAALFDMDGVLVDTEPLQRKAYFQTFSDIGIEVPEKLYATFTGAATKEVCEKLVKTYALTQTPAELAALKRHYFQTYFYTEPDFNLFSGVEQILQDFQNHGIKMVLASSASRTTIDMVFRKFRLRQYFIGQISGDDLEKSKPDPEIFNRAANIAGEPKENCIVVEDSTNGILAAHAAGIFCVGYKSKNSLGQNYDQADLVISDFSEIDFDQISKFF